MKQRKKIQDGIRLYPPPKPKTQPSPFLLAAVQLLAVWFLALSWWQSLTSVLSIQTDTIRLYTLCFLFTAIFAFIWNAPLRTAKKGIFLILLLCLAASWIQQSMYLILQPMHTWLYNGQMLLPIPSSRFPNLKWL